MCHWLCQCGVDAKVSGDSHWQSQWHTSGAANSEVIYRPFLSCKRRLLASTVHPAMNQTQRLRDCDPWAFFRCLGAIRRLAGVVNRLAAAVGFCYSTSLSQQLAVSRECHRWPKRSLTTTPGCFAVGFTAAMSSARFRWLRGDRQARHSASQRDRAGLLRRPQRRLSSRANRAVCRLGCRLGERRPRWGSLRARRHRERFADDPRFQIHPLGQPGRTSPISKGALNWASAGDARAYRSGTG